MAKQDVSIIIKAFDKTKTGFSGVTSGLKKVSGAVFNMKSALVGAVGTAGFGALIKSSINAGDELAKTADKLGVTTTALSGLRHAAELTGVSTGTMDMAMQRFTRRAAEAAQGTGEAKGALQELGINAEELVKLPLDQQMSVVADSMAGVERQSDKVRLAMKLFDSEGVALVNTLGGGSAALEKMTAEAEQLGVTLSRTDTAQMEAANDSLTRLKAVFTGLTNQLSVAFAPIITFVADGFRQAALDSTDFGNIGQKVANTVVKAFGFVRNVVHDLQIFFLSAKVSVLEFANSIGDRLVPFLQTFIDAYNKIASVNPFMDSITESAEQLMGSLPDSIAATNAQLELLKKQNPGKVLVADITEFIAKNREAAETVAELKDGIAKLPAATVTGFQKMGNALDDFLNKLPTLKDNLDTLTKSTFKRSAYYFNNQ